MTEIDLAAILRAHGLRVTPQREAILRAFDGNGDEHLSAEEVASRAAATVPHIGRGTVYATLAELAELELLASVGSADPIRYEANLAPHDHFRCRLCMRLFDVDLGVAELADRTLAGFTIHSVSVMSEGVCAQCHDYQRGLREGAADCLTTETLPAADLQSLSCSTLEGPVGELAVAASDEGIVHVSFSDHADFDGLRAVARSRGGSEAARVRLRDLCASLQAYFGGSRAAIEDVIDWRLLSDQQRLALQSVQRIPSGTPLSYERLDSTLSAYERGRLMGCNPLPLISPCHRVSRGSERMADYVGGAERLQVLRRLETG
jgi:Fe2+ or Zn2+ uptake regulation protein/O6-methylguanine-DNA--protein-cysteine methyltransferase